MVYGKTNSGKSSLINALNYNNEIAKTALLAGKTQKISFYIAQHNNFKKQKGLLVDVPGHGWGNYPLKVRKKYEKMMNLYFGFGVRINLIMYLVKTMQGLKEEDYQRLEEMQHFKKPILLVMSQADKVVR